MYDNIYKEPILGYVQFLSTQFRNKSEALVYFELREEIHEKN